MKTNRKKDPQKPELPAKSTSALRAIAITEFEDERIYENVNVTSPQPRSNTAKFVVLRTSDAKNTDFAAAELPKLHLTDVTLTECDLSNADLGECSATRVLIENCRMIGFRALESVWEDLTVKNCQATYATFGESSFKRVIFEDCDLTDADFIRTTFSAATFLNCTLLRTRFSEAQCKGTDFRGSDLEGIIIGPKELQGAVIEPSQAAVLISRLGVVVKWPDED